MNDLEFLEEDHLYIYKGIVIPSVSEILKFIFPDKYNGIPNEILQNKAVYGTKLHELVETLDKEQMFDNEPLNYIKSIYKFNKQMGKSLEQYLNMKEKYDIEVLGQEQMVAYKGMYAGRYDKEGKVKGKTALLDVKTTYELDEEYLSWQLSLYELAIGKKYEKLYCIWLPKNKLGKLVEIKRKPKKELIKMLDMYFNKEKI